MYFMRAITSLVSPPAVFCMALLASGLLRAEPIRLTVEEADYAPDRPLVNPVGYHQAGGQRREVERISILLDEDEDQAAPASWRPTGGSQNARPPEPPPVTESEGDPPLKIYRIQNGNLVDPEGPEEPGKVKLGEDEASPIPPQYSFRPPGSQAESEADDSEEVGSQTTSPDAMPQPPKGRQSTVRLAPVIRARDLEASAREGQAVPQLTIGDRPPPTPARPATVQRVPVQPVAEPPVTEQPITEPPVAEPPAPVKPFAFAEVEPGTTTVAQIQEMLGPPDAIEQAEESAIFIYEAPAGFSRIELVVADQRVESTLVVFTEPRPLPDIVAQLGLKAVRPARVFDEVGLVVGTVYPERGILLVRVESPPEDTSVESVILQSPVAEAFYLRAQDRPVGQIQERLSDLREAVRLDPDYGEAWWQLARLLDRAGAKEEALEAIEQALVSPDGGPGAELTHAVMQAQGGNYSASIARIREIAEDTDVPPEVRARAYCSLGDLLQLGGEEKNRQAMEDHLQAIELAAKLVNQPQMLPRRAAKQVLIDAHLGLAIDIAAGPWEQQGETVAKWLGQADSLIEDLIENEEGSAEWSFRRLRRGLVAQSYLDSESSIRESIDPIETLGRQLIRESGDPAYRQIIEWETGQSMIQAFFMAYAQQDHDEALAMAQRAYGYYAAAQNHRKLSIADTMMLANLYFRAGTLLALEQEDHTAALTWYGRAIPLLTSPEVAHLMHQRRGESLVSMAVSYWEDEQKEEAIRLTEQGLEILQAGVDRKSTDPQKLQVPLANLAKMHRDLGDTKKSAEYTAARRKINEAAPGRRNPLR